MSLTVPNVNCVSPGFHVKHVDTELTFIAEVRGHQRTLDELTRNGCGCMTCQSVGCRDNRSAGWGVAWNHREVRTTPDQYLPPLAEWIDLGRGRKRPQPALRAFVLESGVGRGRCGRPRADNAGSGHHNPAGSIKLAAWCPQR